MAGTETTCPLAADRPFDRVALRSGLRRVGIHRVVVGDGPPEEAPGVSWPLRAGLAGTGAALGVGLLAAIRRLGIGAGRASLLLAAWLLTPLLARADLDAALQACRIIADHPLWWAPGLPLCLSAAGVGLALQGRFVRPSAPLPRWAVPVAGLLAGLPVPLATGWAGLAALPLGAGAAVVLAAVARRLGPAADRAVAGAAVFGLGAGVVAALLAPRWWVAVPLTEGAAVLLALLVWANVRAREVRAFNLVSLACVVGAVALAEQALTWTATGLSLVGVSSRTAAAPAPGAADDLGTAFHSFEALEHTRQFQRYPIQDYPVAPPPRSAAIRIAAVGGSSTAGAYQNDDIDQFWPADLDRILGPEVQVINQGVGGWTSLHVRRYLETRQDIVDADIIVAYLGHNDLLTESPRPYRQLYETWAAGGSPSTAISRLLGDVRLYQLLRFSIQALVGVGTGPAVPLPDARDNLQAIAELQRRRGGRLLLVTEGLSPDPAAMAPYGRMMAELAAESPDVAWLDGAALLADPARTGLFLDDCHLTRQGHELLASAIAETLRQLGWVP
ncbi:MAG: SGNH/GDSL hydrolase family protein [Deltaproteobacteria bacterium]|nr:MAG: SGNH/GDSL hydrolase family protein [Deltaproteobacteria bacterium]